MEEQEIRDKLLVELGQSVAAMLQNHLVKNRIDVTEMKEAIAAGLGGAEGVPEALTETNEKNARLLDNMSSIVVYLALLEGSMSWGENPGKFKDLKAQAQRKLEEKAESYEQEMAAFKQRITKGMTERG